MRFVGAMDALRKTTSEAGTDRTTRSVTRSSIPSGVTHGSVLATDPSRRVLILVTLDRSRYRRDRRFPLPKLTGLEGWVTLSRRIAQKLHRNRLGLYKGQELDSEVLLP